MRIVGSVSALAVGLALAGCATWYEPATIENGVVSNPTVGWAGYSFPIPQELVLIHPLPGGEESDRARAFQRWYDDQTNRWAGDYYNTFTERFIFEAPDRSFTINFLAETYELPAGWNAMTSVELGYVIKKMINRKKVVINDGDAVGEAVKINGRRGWRVSGVARPYSKHNTEQWEYEGRFVLGGLREAYWIEGFGRAGSRDEMRRFVEEIARGLVVNEVAK